jgi:type II secretory pathway component PulF
MLLRHITIGLREGSLDAPFYHAEAYLRAVGRRWDDLAIQIGWPLAILYMGALMGALCLAIFLMITSLVDAAISVIG